MKSLLVGVSLFAATAALAESAAPPAPALVVWRLNQTAQIGGHAAEVLGAPRIVKEAGDAALEFNGTSDGLFMPVNPLAGWGTFTIEMLFKPAAGGPEAQRFLHVQDTIGAAGDPGSRALMEIRLANGTWALDTFLFSKVSNDKLPLLDETKRHPADRWTWVALVYSPGHMASYVDGAKELEGAVNFPPLGAGRVSLGVRQNKVYWFKGQIREVRFHPAALKAEQLQR